MIPCTESVQGKDQNEGPTPMAVKVRSSPGHAGHVSAPGSGVSYLAKVPKSS